MTILARRLTIISLSALIFALALQMVVANNSRMRTALIHGSANCHATLLNDCLSGSPFGARFVTN
ncbi:hypothetical protein [Rhizobium alvei]|uniref:Uncharacterized protein n=1 Tax=Rhizobium alvei TaxID=1132659 RepID=A0ABT8YTU4_9HYPH|nr:hypothetical protein [Rhizobium alvei]MDO6966773.1 hypothetical protein [Rhizobium alvei]